MQWLGLPGWLVAGLIIGGVFTLVALPLFLLGPRLLPPPGTRRDAGADDGRRRAEIRGYLRYIDEPFTEDAAVGGETVAFYLPERDVAVTFDARAYFRLDGTDTDAVLAEHEMPGAALGARLPFETPTPGGRTGVGGPDRDRVGASGARAARQSGPVADAGPDGGATAEAFATLGLAPGAPVEDVRDAYREQVKAVHPDHGGDQEAFQQLQEAYAVALEAAS